MATENRVLKKLKDYDIESLLIEVRQGRKLICFGAGKALAIFLDKMADYALEEYIYAIADNDQKRQETVYEIAGGKNILIGLPKNCLAVAGLSFQLLS